MYKQTVIKLIQANIALCLANILPVAMAAEATVVLQGSVESACSITDLATSAQLGSLKEGGSTAVKFTYSCNTAFGYTLESLNGGLKLSGGTTVAEYSVETTLPTDGATSISDTCSSADIKVGSVTCTFTTSGTDIATALQGTLDITWEANEELPTGSYEDSLSISIEALP